MLRGVGGREGQADGRVEADGELLGPGRAAPPALQPPDGPLDGVPTPVGAPVEGRLPLPPVRPLLNLVAALRHHELHVVPPRPAPDRPRAVALVPDQVQTLAGLVALCPARHGDKHVGRAQVRGRGDDAEARLHAVNRWTREKTDAYVDLAFEAWSVRSAVT